MFTFKVKIPERINEFLVSFMFLFRVDDRLIHGTVTVSWAKAYNLKRIYVVNDEISKNAFQKQIIKTSAASILRGVKVDVLDVKGACELLRKDSGDENTMFIFKTPLDFLRMVKEFGSKDKFKVLNIGFMGYSKGKKDICKKFLFASDEEIEALKEIVNMGIELDVRTSANGPSFKINLP